MNTEIHIAATLIAEKSAKNRERLDKKAWNVFTVIGGPSLA